jgi:endoglucanase
VVVLQPDFPELKEGWPFLWYENEYVVDGVTSFILAANAAHAETETETDTDTDTKSETKSEN